MSELGHSVSDTLGDRAASDLCINFMGLQSQEIKRRAATATVLATTLKQLDGTIPSTSPATKHHGIMEFGMEFYQVTTELQQCFFLCSLIPRVHLGDRCHNNTRPASLPVCAIHVTQASEFPRLSLWSHSHSVAPWFLIISLTLI